MPVYLHKDARIEGMMLINMLVLLAYSLLEREVRQHGLHLTANRVIDKLRSIDVIETQCWEGSSLCRLTPIDAEQLMILEVLGQIIQVWVLPHGLRLPLPSSTQLPLILPPPEPQPPGG